MTPVAVLGAGFQGVCAALELAQRGVAVDLYDRHDACITQAGARNEGKIHVGFVYANDPSFDTTRLMVRGALTFDAALKRWLERDVAEMGLSTPHDYAVHRDSLLRPDAVLAHFARVRDLVRESVQPGRSTYLGQDARAFGFRRCETNGVYDPSIIDAVIRTDERAVDVASFATHLRARVAADSRITFHPRTEIKGAARVDGSIAIWCAREGATSIPRYRHAINCLWDGKLPIDRDMQLLPPYRSLFRLKYGVTIDLAEAIDAIPSTTIVVGPFGDIVHVNDRRLYLSWYPVARRGMSRALTPPDWARELAGKDAEQMIDATLDAFARMIRPMRALHRGLFVGASVKAGIVVAAGETDIDDPRSRLHTRTAVGIRSREGYHSVDTGKYTLAPMYAVEIADRVCGSA
jgi:hypothetical protein